MQEKCAVRSGKNITGNLFTKRNTLPISSGGVSKDCILFLIMCMWICLCICVWACKHVCRCPHGPELLNNPQADWYWLNSGNWITVLYKSNVCSNSLSHLQSLTSCLKWMQRKRERNLNNDRQCNIRIARPTFKPAKNKCFWENEYKSHINLDFAFKCWKKEKNWSWDLSSMLYFYF